LEIVRKKRIRRLVSELNKQRRLQGRKIDILCNDIIASQKNFLNQLRIMSLQIDLYESLIGTSDLEGILNDFLNTIQQLSDNINIAIWIQSGFLAYAFDEQDATDEKTELIESCFSVELAEKIYNSRRCIELEELFEIGLPQSQILFNLSAAVIPLQNICQHGFILLYRDASKPITQREISDVSMLVPGLSRAIKACQKVTQPVIK
jgi:hypothetical protein